MAISKKQEAVIDMIVSYKPTTWVIATKSEAKKIPEEGRAEFVKTLLHGMDIYKSKVSNAASILKRGPNLNPEVNIRAWALMHARYLARLFIKHPTLCERLCVKVSNETYNPGWTGDVKRFRSIEDHKEEIEEQVENACRESQLYFSTHSGYNFIITNNVNSVNTSHSKTRPIPQNEAQSRQLAAESLLALPQRGSSATGSLQIDGTNDRPLGEAQQSYAFNPPSRMSPKMGVFQVNISNNQPPNSILRRRNRTRQPKHVRFALAVEQNATAELEIINKMDVDSLYRTPQRKAHQLHLDRQRQAKAAPEDEDMYGVSDEEMNRSANTRKLNKRKGVARPYNLRIPTSQEPATITDSDFEDDIQLTPISPDSDATISDHGEGLGGKYSWHSNGMALRNHFLNIQGGITNKAAALTLTPESEDDAEDEDSSAVESIDGDNEEQFSLKEMIDAMEYLADHPWICENGMVDHVWDEYKLFHEYNSEALKVAEEEIQEMEKAAATETTASAHKEKEVDCVPTFTHRTRSTDQNAPSSNTFLPSAALSVGQEEVADGTNAHNAADAAKAEALSAAFNSSDRNRNLQMQVAAVYDAFPDRTPVDANTFSGDNAPPRGGRSSDRSVPDYNAPARRSQSSDCQEQAVQVINDDDTITVDTSPGHDPVESISVPAHTAPPRRGRSSDRSIPVYTAPLDRSPSSISQDKPVHGVDDDDTITVDASPSPIPAHSAPPRRGRSSANPKAIEDADDNDTINVGMPKKVSTTSPTKSRFHAREQLQIAVVLNSLGRQNDMPFGYDGASGDEEEEVVAEPTITTLKRTRSEQPADKYRPSCHRRGASFGLAEEDAASTHGRPVSLREELDDQSTGFTSTSSADQSMDLVIHLAPPPRRGAPTFDQDQATTTADRTNTAPEIEFPEVARSRPQTRSMKHQTTAIDGPSQAISDSDDRKVNDPWFNGVDSGDLETLDMDLNLNLDMDLDTDLLPYPNWDSFDKPGQRGAHACMRHGRNSHSRGMGGFGSSGMNGMHQSFGGMKQPFGNLHKPSAGSEIMDQFKQKTPREIFNDLIDFGDVNQSFDQPDELDIDVQGAPQTPQIPRRTRASTRSQREYDFSAKSSAYFESKGTQSTDEKDEEDFEEESPSKRACHRKDTSKSSAKNSTKNTPKRSRKSTVKKGPKVPFAPRSASAPSTLDRRPVRETRQTKLISAGVSHGMLGAQLTTQISQLATTAPIRTRSKSKGKLGFDLEDPDL
ncbi:hypothetical protein OCU04_006627 [Sclerotinia nivalis]|uniref:Uncharacterized protein n=1 Tax=Sclerotinia nivalis TaxID=352851 RepID=A0A9X0AK70_9HELO|nr:hypothetical protein OCU04_006627 [Sclerotinia nivalis]